MRRALANSIISDAVWAPFERLVKVGRTGRVVPECHWMNEWMNEWGDLSYRTLSRGSCVSTIRSVTQFSFQSATETSECQRLCSSAYGALQICLWLWLGSSRSKTIRDANFYIVFHSNYGSVLLSFRDITTGWTMDDGRHRQWRQPSQNLQAVKLMQHSSNAYTHKTTFF